jgi:aspartate racemase
MKVIGLIGGTSWPSTFSYYEQLNRAAQKALGGFHSARIMLYSIDYHPIKNLYHDGWDRIPALLADEIRYFLAKQPDCLILCNNTLHRALDAIRDNVNIAVPVFHAGHLAAEEAQRRGCKKVLLLGTSFTMEDGFFTKYFQDKGIEVAIPSPDDRRIIQDIQSELARGNINPTFESKFVALLHHYPDVDAIVLACTELPLIINDGNSPKALINTIQCQCDAAAKFAFNTGV